MSNSVIAGIGMTAFVKPEPQCDYRGIGAEATRLALRDAGIDYSRVQQAFAGWVYGDSTCWQAALYGVGLTGVPIINVNNNCATGSTALFLARQAVESGAADCVLALGFEQMAPGPLSTVFADRAHPLQSFLDIADRQFENAQAVPMACRLFAAAGYEYQHKFGAKAETFAKIREKAGRHAEHNDKAIFRRPVSIEEIMASPSIFLNLTRLQCCPPTCGAAAAVLCSAAFARQYGVRGGVSIAGQALTTDRPSTFEGRDMMKVVGYDLTRAAAQQAYSEAGIDPVDVDVAELHDCFTTNELISYEALALCAEGEAESFVWSGRNTYGGKVVTNPSGGLLCKGHPLGATGLAQCAELVTQLRGGAGRRQVADARIALQHNLGLGGACVVTLYVSAHR